MGVNKRTIHWGCDCGCRTTYCSRNCEGLRVAMEEINESIVNCVICNRVMRKYGHRRLRETHGNFRGQRPIEED